MKIYLFGIIQVLILVAFDYTVVYWVCVCVSLYTRTKFDNFIYYKLDMNILF